MDQVPRGRSAKCNEKNSGSENLFVCRSGLGAGLRRRQEETDRQDCAEKTRRTKSRTELGPGE